MRYRVPVVSHWAEYLDQGLIPLVLHLADHDPNGIDMTRDNEKRLALYARAEIEVRRIALTMDQVQHYRPPPNFAKEKDKRFAGYVRQFGTTECWELDALSPTVISNLIRNEIETLIDHKHWRKAISSEDRSRETLAKVADNWTKVANLLRRAGHLMRPSLRRSEIESQGAQRMARELHIGEWIAVAVTIVALLVWWLLA